MAVENDIQKELRDIAPGWAGFSAVPPFESPSPAYFEALPGIILRRILAGDALTVEEEIRLLAPTLSGLKQKTTFRLPEDFFDRFSANTLPKTEATVLPIHHEEKPTVTGIPIQFRRTAVRYAVAAVMTGLIVIGGWFLFSRPAVQNEHPAWVQTGEAAVEKQIRVATNAVSDADMIHYLDTNFSLFSVYSSTDTAAITQADIPLLLADISDQELQYFLDHDDPRAG